ncbi:MAG: glycosyltransferase family 9 protein [Planctomycetota bacterium]
MTQRILLVKFGPIGDVVMATPILEAAARLTPGSQVTWLTTASLAPLIARLRPAPEIITVDDHALWHGNLWQRAQLLINLRRRLAGRRFDLGLFAHANRRMHKMLWGLSVGAWRSFNLAAGLPRRGSRHHDEHVRLLTGADQATPSIAAYPTIELHVPTLALPPHPRVAIVPGGARNPLREDVLRRWPLAHYVALARLLNARGINVILAGGPDDAWTQSAFAGIPVTDTIGKTSIVGALDLFAVCDVVVAHDSGPMHLADLAGVPVIALFGPTSPHEKGPIGKQTRILWGGENLTCRPCYDGVNYADCNRNQCLEEVTPEQVLVAILAVQTNS